MIRVVGHLSTEEFLANRIVRAIAPVTTPVSFRVEAEAMSLDGYFVRTGQSFASGNAYIELNAGISGAVRGTASYTFVEVPGIYDIEVSYFDENDGLSQGWIKLNGTDLTTWVWNESTGSPVAAAATRRTRIVPAVALTTGDLIQLQSTRHTGENGRYDDIFFRAIP